MSNSMLWTERYRPKHLEQVCGQDVLKQYLQRVANGGILDCPHLILHGPPGTGKTTMAIAFANDVYPAIPSPISTMYLNASDERTMETVRERIREFLKTHWIGITRKIVIFDEVETMTEPAQLTLRSLMDSPLIPGYPLPLFIFLCNTLSRIVPLVRSRALPLFCGHLTSNQIRGLLTEIQTKEAKDTPLPTPLACLLNRGDMRSFMQRAQQNENPNTWLPWLQRLLNTSADRCQFVWEEGLQRIPVWILLRHVLVFFYSMNLPSLVPSDVWTQWLTATIQLRNVANTATILDQILAAWTPLIQALHKK